MQGWCWTWCSASAACSPGTMPLMLQGAQDRVGLWLLCLLTSQCCLSSSWWEASVKLLLGRRYPALLELERKLQAGRAGSGGGS